jgi:hypothetical protein
MRYQLDRPASLSIPHIGVSASIEAVPLQSISDKETPRSWWDAAWFSRGVEPGAPGVALVYAHLDSTTGPALFWNLHNLVPRNRVTIFYHHHRSITFEVVKLRTYWDSQVPLKFIGTANVNHLMVLMTCAGTYYPGTGYDHRLIVYTKQIA